MGLGHWNRRRRSESIDPTMDDSSNIETLHSQDPDLVTLLAYLIRSGGATVMNSEDDDDEYIEDKGNFVTPTSAPPVDSHLDTSVMDTSELKLEMLNYVNKCKFQTGSRKMPSINQLLAQRELGSVNRSDFSKTICQTASSCFVPSRPEIKEHFSNRVFCGTYSQSGDIFLSACQDRQIRIYDTSHGRFKRFNSIHALDVGWSVLDTSFSPDSKFLVYSSWSDYLHLCDVNGRGHQVHEALPLIPNSLHGFCIFSVVFSQDNREILGGANDRSLYVFDLERKERTLRVDAHDDDVNAVAFADEGSQILFSGSDDGLCKIWDRRTLRESDPCHVGVLAGHLDGITFIDSRGDGRYLLSNCKDQSIKLWDMRQLSSKKAQEETKRSVGRQNWDYRRQQVPRAVLRNRQKIPGDSSLMTYRGHTVLNTLIRARFSPKFNTGQRYIYTGCASGAIVIYDILTGQIVKKLQGHKACVRDVTWHPYNNTIMSTSWDCTVTQWSYCEKDDEEEAKFSSSETCRPNTKRQKLRF